MYSEMIEKVITKRMVDKDADISKTNEMIDLIAAGWRGDIPMHQVTYYTDRYRSLYPGLAESEYIKMAADYLGGAKARYDLGGRAEPKTDVGSFISISFVPPVPGAPEAMFANNLYYRTVPTSDGRTHIAPWRAKGYLHINSDNDVKVKVTSWGNKELDVLPIQVSLDAGGDPLLLDADYNVAEYIQPVFM